VTGGAPPLLLHVFATFAVGGPQVRFTTLANRMGGAFRHAVIAMDGQMAARDLLSRGLDVTFPDVAITRGDTLGNLRGFRRALRAMCPDLLVTSNWGTIEWSLARVGLAVPHLHMEDGFGPEERAAQLPRRVIARRLLLRRATVVVPSRLLWRIARDQWRLPEGRLRHMPNGVDLTRFAARRAARDTADDAVIGTVAALRAEKNIARLIRATALLPRDLAARLVVVGEGPERAALEALAAAEGIADRVVFAGHASDPARHYADFDLFALSSDTEQMPLSVLEAMAAGLPVAATDVGDVREMLAEANHAFVVDRTKEALADAIAALVRDADARRALGAANQARASSTYGEDGMVAAWRELFSGLAISQR
jgi:glycosyltransferase involved in cell wall biosynthesis